MFLTGTPNIPKFSSGGAQAASNLYYLNWLAKQNEKKQEALSQQKTQLPMLPPMQRPVEQDFFQPQALSLKFGADSIS